jgi:colanic acid/amylovoran biosynthesis glycosyltransferase
MKVLYPLRYYPTLSETFIYREIDGVGAAGIDVTIAALGERSDGVLQDEAPRAPVLRVPRSGSASAWLRPSTGQRWLARQQRPKDARRLPWLRQQVERLGIVHVHAHFGGEAAEWAHALWLDLGLPYTVTVHAVDLFKPRPALAEVLGAAQKVLTVATSHRPLLATFGIEPTLVRCGVDLDRHTAGPPPQGPLRALFAGRDVPKKGLDTLLDAWEGLDLPDARLTLVTDRGGNLPAGVTSAGLLPPKELRARFAQCNAFVLPCRLAADGDRDGVPVVLMEALATGRAVITTPVSGIPELVDEQVGWLVPPDRADLLREALQEAHHDVAMRARRGAAGPDRLRTRGFLLADQIAGVLAAWQPTI